MGLMVSGKILMPNLLKNDMRKKGRAKGHKGEQNFKAKLTDERVRLIRQLSERGIKSRRLAEQFGVNCSTISRIVKGKLWLHI